MAAKNRKWQHAHRVSDAAFRPQSNPDQAAAMAEIAGSSRARPHTPGQHRGSRARNRARAINRSQEET